VAIKLRIKSRKNKELRILYFVIKNLKIKNMSASNLICAANKDTFTAAEKLFLSDKKIALDLFFGPPESFLNDKGKQQYRRNCKTCKISKLGDLPGHGNFLKHITTCVPMWQDKIVSFKGQATGGPLDSSLSLVSDKAKTIHAWMEWTIMTDSPSTFVENKYNRKYAKIEAISRRTFNKYKDTVYKMVVNKIKEELPTTFMVYFDGWSCDGEHYLGIFATWTNSSGGVIVRCVT